jgi:alkylation response protein AidB-like acyl-CoA dehydrogenase
MVESTPVETVAVPALETFRRFFREEFEAAADEIEQTDRIPESLLRRTAEVGAYRLTLPVENGGLGLPAGDYLPYLEAAAMGPGAGRMLVHVANGLWRPLVEFGDWRQQELARRLGSGEICLAFALTERSGGTGRDLRSLATRSGSGWTITGEKHLITFADRAEVFLLVVASDERRAKDSLTAFLVPRETPGFEVDATQRTMGIHGTGHGWLRFRDMFVDDDSRLGEVGQGLDVALSFLDYSRLSLSTCMVGLAQRALDEAVEFAKVRETFGKPIAQRQAVQAHIADMQADIYAARALVRMVADVYDASGDVTPVASAAKLFCLNMVSRVTDHALRVHGGFGYTKDAAIERIYRDARGFWFEEGTQEIQQLVVARDVLDRG